MSSLYQLTAAQRAMQAQLENAGFDDQTISDTLEAEGDDLLEKRLGYIAIIKSKRAFAQARAAAASDMAMLADAEAVEVKRMEKALMASMAATGDTALIGLQFEAKIRKNPAAVEIADAAHIPKTYWRTPAYTVPDDQPDKAAIKLALQAGKDVPGARLVQGIKLVIK